MRLDDTVIRSSDWLFLFLFLQVNYSSISDRCRSLHPFLIPCLLEVTGNRIAIPHTSKSRFTVVCFLVLVLERPNAFPLDDLAVNGAPEFNHICAFLELSFGHILAKQSYRPCKLATIFG